MTPNLDKIVEHYNHALEKHPYFADKLFRYTKEEHLPLFKASIKNCKWQIETLPNNGNGELDVYPLLSCRWFELVRAYLSGNSSVAIDKAYKCIVVLLRLIDVLEGRQKLGKPEEVNND